MGPIGPHLQCPMGPRGPCRRNRAGPTLGVLLRHPGAAEKGSPMIPAAIARVLIVACLRIGMVLSVLYRFIISRRQRKARRYITRACAAVTAGIALAAVGVTAASASAAAPRAAPVTAAGT